MKPDHRAFLTAEILDLSRQNNIGPLSPYFEGLLQIAIDDGALLPTHTLELVAANLIHQLVSYRIQTGKGTVVLGMSGGVDSALSAALFKKAGYRVIGVTMPINQVQAETDRGIEACKALGIEHIHKDLTELYNFNLATLADLDPDVHYIADPADPNAKAVKIRRGNIRARLRMITVYNLASLYGGFVASTDNLSELLAGFWTLHGDVGDVSPIQSLWKSWEVPYLAKIMGVPESTWRATPTDGLGIDAGDEAQLGASYLEWDLMVYAIANALTYGTNIEAEFTDDRARQVYKSVFGRMQSTWFKRMNPINLKHIDDRYAMVEMIDDAFFRPAVVK